MCSTGVCLYRSVLASITIQLANQLELIIISIHGGLANASGLSWSSKDSVCVVRVRAFGVSRDERVWIAFSSNLGGLCS